MRYRVEVCDSGGPDVARTHPFRIEFRWGWTAEEGCNFWGNGIDYEDYTYEKLPDALRSAFRNGFRRVRVSLIF